MKKGVPSGKCCIPIPLLRTNDFHQKSRALKSPKVVCLTLPECFPTECLPHFSLMSTENTLGNLVMR